MCRARPYSAREFKKILTRNGYHYESCNGSHFKYVKGNDSVVITKDLNSMVARRLIKEHNLII